MKNKVTKKSLGPSEANPEISTNESIFAKNTSKANQKKQLAFFMVRERCDMVKP